VDLRGILESSLIQSAGLSAHSAQSFEEMQRTIAEAREEPTARRAVERVMQEVQAFEKQLDEKSEIGMLLVSFGSAVVVHVREVGYWQPNLIVFAGERDDGSPVRLIQHISQLSFMLMKVPRLAPDEPRRPIGFNLGEAE
jgi:hypothetical protein